MTTFRVFSSCTSLLIVLILPGMMLSCFLPKETPALRCVVVTFPAKGYDAVFAEPMDIYRDYQSFTLSADSTANAREMKRIRLALHTIKQRRDERKGVHVRFDDAMAFRDFISCTDVCRAEFPALFCCYGNDLYAIYGSRSPVPPGSPNAVPQLPYE